MYKAGKKWVIAGLITAVAGVSMGVMTTSVTTKADTHKETTTVSKDVKSDTAQKTEQSDSSDTQSNGSAAASVDNGSQAASQASSASSSSSSKAASTSSASSSNANKAGQLNSSVASNATDEFKSHLREIDGKTYYYDANNNPVKSELFTDNGKTYFFGKDEALTTFSPNFDSGKIDGNNSTAAYSSDAKSITNVDGFMTAGSWYRPKTIFDGDKSRPSNDGDFRPVLSAWWPNKQIEINYLNYMSKNGLVSGTFDKKSSDAEMNAAAAIVRIAIEARIKAANGSLDGIKALFNNFVKTQDQWNITSEDYNLNDGFQGGTLMYGNNDQTQDANSDYRLINRTPSKQDGKVNYHKTNDYGYEFLLANDVDNSNPVVQAETLNWLHYLMNFGKITQNDANANFDGVRVDAVDNMDADVLNIISDYFKDAYGINKNDKNANNHLAILEDWSENDPKYLKDQGSNLMTIDSGFLNALRSALTNGPKGRKAMSSLINAGVVNRRKDTTYNKNMPNYSIIRAHDAGVQTVIAQIIKDHIDANSNGLNPTWSQINQAFKIYNADEKKTNKKYTQYNIPSAYALLLTNKDTTPRVYYGDLFTDNGQFMATKSPYYQAITTMLRGRIKYVSGGQAMKTVPVNHGKDSILVSVRYGKGADNVRSKGTKITRKSGIAVIESNNSKMKLNKRDKVVIYMGAAHKNQAYRPLLTTTRKGITTYQTDKGAKRNYVYTDSKGRLVLKASQIKGYANPQVSGFLSMWVPVGATKHQDVRTAASKKTTKDGQSFHSNSSLDSNVIFEAFSNFQSMPKKTSQYENVIVAKKAAEFKNLGFTNIELPPQYRSTNDATFLDSTVQNGYSFNDRYDLGFNTPTKYGTADQLTNAIKSLHAQGLKVLADFVPDQLYALPNQQVVSATRVNSKGVLDPKTNLIDILYDSNTKGSGKDYQNKYGGAFLKELQRMYPDIFAKKQISTGMPIDPSTQIKTWDARYFNGSNIQGNGAEYVLSNSLGSDYFTVNDSNNKNIKTSVLPKQLLGQSVTYGLTKVNGEVKYITPSGYVATNSFLKDASGNWYYVNANGNFITAPTTINGREYFFLNNGINLRDALVKNTDGSLSYYQANGVKAKNAGYYISPNVDRAIYIDESGSVHTGALKISKTYQYFDANGHQIKGNMVTVDGKKKYFAPGSGNIVRNSFFSFNNNWYYANSYGNVVTGKYKIKGKYYYFYRNGVQNKGHFVVNKNYMLSYYNAKNGQLVKHSFRNKGHRLTVSRYGNILIKSRMINTTSGKFLMSRNHKVMYGLRRVRGKYYYFGKGAKLVTKGTVKVHSVTYRVRNTGTIIWSSGKVANENDLNNIKKQLASEKKKQSTQRRKFNRAKKALKRGYTYRRHTNYRKALASLRSVNKNVAKLNKLVVNFNK